MHAVHCYPVDRERKKRNKRMGNMIRYVGGINNQTRVEKPVRPEL